MEIVNSSNLRSFNINNQEFHNIAIGMTIYLMLSFMRGFIPVTIGFILELPGITNEFAAIFGIIPMTSLFLFRMVKSRYNQFLRFSIIIWFLAIIIDNLLLKFLLILIGMYISYSLILFLLTLKLSIESITQSVIYMIFIDFVLKSVNHGNDPIASYNLTSIIFVFIFALLFSLLIYVNAGDLNVDPIEFQHAKSKDNIISNLSTIGFFLSLLVYFVFFSNPGIVTLSLGISDQFMISIFIIGVTSISLLSLAFYEKFNSNPPIFLSLCVLLFFSILFVPWEGGYFIFFVIGLFCLVNILMFNLSKMPRNISESTSATYFISLLFFLIFLFLIISKDGTSLPMIFTAMAVVLSSVSYVYNKTGEVQK